MRVSFGGHELDTSTYELRHAGEPVALEPQVFDVLALLIRHRDRVVTKEELLDEVWGDRFVSESALTSRIKDARRAVGDDGRRQQVIRTAHGRGYQFVADVTVHAGGGEALPEDRPAHNLPADRTPLLGRDADVEAVATLVGAHRLVTVLGIGGLGKTRLAAAAARRVLGGFDDGVWFVDLVPAGDAHAVETAVAQAVGISLPAGDGARHLARVLDERRLLIVLDNCEHVRDEVAALADHLLEATAAPHLLATSREPLALPDERRFVLDPLDVDGVSSPAVALLLASAERFGVTLGDGDWAVVERICRHLDGLPLAIELSAAQLRVLTPEEVAERLDRRFELLRAEAAPGRERHASLTSVLEGTWGLLDPGEQELVGALAAFPGPFALADAEELLAGTAPEPVAPSLAELVDRSLVVRRSEEPRFRLLETVRLFADEHGDGGRHRERHAAWCRERVGDDLQVHLHDFSLASWAGAHYDDLRAAEGHLLAAGRPEDAAVLVGALGLAMHCDAGARAADLLPRIDGLVGRLDAPGLVARAAFTGVLAGMAVRSPSLIARHGAVGLEAAEAAGDDVLLATALVLRSWSTVFDDPDAAVTMVREAAARAEAAGEDRARDLAEGYLAFHLALLHRYEEAIEQSRAVLDRQPAVAEYRRFVPASALCSLQAVHDPAEARQWIDFLRSLPDVTMWANHVLGACVLAGTDEVAEAAALADQARRVVSRAGHDPYPDLLLPPAVLAHHLGDDERAARWVRAIRDAGRPTQSFQATCTYRRLRQRTGVAPEDPLADRRVGEVGDEALDWMRSVAEGGRSAAG